MFKRLVLPLSFSLFFLAPTDAKTIEGINIPAQTTVSGQSLVLNGAGVRSVKLVFIPIKAYVASFYAPEKLGTEKAVLASSGPLQFNFTFLQGVNQSQVTQAWNAQFEDSVTFTYDGLAQDQIAFVKMFGPLKTGGVEKVEIQGNETRVYDNGKLQGTIQGRNFQKAFLSLWFGSKPVMPSLKSDLLGTANK